MCWTLLTKAYSFPGICGRSRRPALLLDYTGGLRFCFLLWISISALPPCILPYSSSRQRARHRSTSLLGPTWSSKASSSTAVAETTLVHIKCNVHSCHTFPASHVARRFLVALVPARGQPRGSASHFIESGCHPSALLGPTCTPPHLASMALLWLGTGLHSSDWRQQARSPLSFSAFTFTSTFIDDYSSHQRSKECQVSDHSRIGRQNCNILTLSGWCWPGLSPSSSFLSCSQQTSSSLLALSWLSEPSICLLRALLLLWSGDGRRWSPSARFDSSKFRGRSHDNLFSLFTARIGLPFTQLFSPLPRHHVLPPLCSPQHGLEKGGLPLYFRPFSLPQQCQSVV